MTCAIVTRYHGPTTFKPAKYSATNANGKRVYVPNQSGFSHTVNHLMAAEHLAKIMKWPGVWQGADLDNKGGMVWVNSTDNFAGHYRFVVEKVL